MDKSRKVEFKEKRLTEMRDDIIIETKVSLIRRIIEFIISMFFNFLIIFLIIVIIEDIYTVITGVPLIFDFSFITPDIAKVGVYGVLAILILFPLFYILANLWMRFKKYLYDPKEHVMEVPTFVGINDLAEYFQMPPEEIERRQEADELIISENIDNEHMKFLRKEHAKRIEE